MSREKPPEFNSIQTTKISIDDCPNINNYITTDNIPSTASFGITFQKLAQGWKDSGMNMNYCKNALRVIGGECAELGPGYSGDVYSIRDKTKGGQAWNPYQLDSAMRPYPGWTGNMFASHDPPSNMDLNNPCQAPIIAHDLFFTDTNPWENIPIYGPNPLCYGTNPAGLMTKVFKTGAQINYDDSETCNWDGPFCHRSYGNENTQWSGVMWNGGGNSNQGSPWPCYGYVKFLSRLPDYTFPDTISDKCKTEPLICNKAECSILQEESSKEAQKICDKVENLNLNYSE